MNLNIEFYLMEGDLKNSQRQIWYKVSKSAITEYSYENFSSWNSRDSTKQNSAEMSHVQSSTKTQLTHNFVAIFF